MARKPQPPEDTGTWMNTYSDLVTLLLCFFVLLYSMSQIDADKWQRFAQAFRNPGDDTNQVVLYEGDGDHMVPAGGEENLDTQNKDSLPADFNELYEYLKSYTEEHGMTESVEVFQGEDSVYIRFNNNIFFYPDRAELLSTSIPILDFLGDCLMNVDDQIYLININGHTASVEYEGYPVSSWTLSGERATNIAIFMESQKGIDPKKLRPIGYGDNYPVSPNTTEEGRSANRRVDMVIISTNSSFASDGSIYEEFAGLFDPSTFPKSATTSELLDPDRAPASRTNNTTSTGDTNDTTMGTDE